MILKRIIVLFLLFMTQNIFAKKALILSDIHFTPFAECSSLPLFCIKTKELNLLPVSDWRFKDNSPNVQNEETNNYFLVHGLNNLRVKLESKAKFDIFITGDILAHNFDKKYRYHYNPFASNEEVSNFEYKTVCYILLQIHLAFPKSHIYYVLGNNDTDTQDYNLPTKEWLHKISVSASEYLPKQDRVQFITQFSYAGYYSLPLNNNIQLLGLNINAFSNRVTDNISRNIAKNELNWLDGQLFAIANSNRHAIILQHIPFGIDVYSSIHKDPPILLLEENLQSKYLEILKKYSKNISVIYSGHFHSEYWQQIYDIPIIGTISFNVLFGNHGGAKLVDYNVNTGEINNYTTYVVVFEDKSEFWEELYSYPNRSYNHIKLNTFIKTLPYDMSNQKVKNYRLFYNGGSQYHLQLIANDAFWKNYYCFINNLTLKDYQRCFINVDS